MTPRPAARARDHAADGDIADLRWPPSAADLDAISCVDVLSAGGGDLRAWLWQAGRLPRSTQPDAVADVHPIPTDAAVAAHRRPVLWGLAVAATAVMAVASPTLLRTSSEEATLTAPAPPSARAPALGPTASDAAPIRTDGALTPAIARSANARVQVPPVERGDQRDEPRGLAPRLIATTVTHAPDAPIADRTLETLAPANRPAAPAPIDVPPAIVPASLASTSIPSAAFDASAPTLASAIPVRNDSGGTLSTPHAEPVPPAAAPATASVALRAADVASVRETLSRYGAAYSRLDASAARAVWPSVDVRALGRAFSELRSQRVTLADCDIAVDGARAKAACRGAATYVPRAGDQNPRTEARDWRFELEKGRDANWRIASATISVPRESTRGR